MRAACDGLDGLTVLNCNWINIIWSPSRMLRFSGVLPLKKSLTWESFNDSNACMTVFSGRWACENVTKKHVCVSETVPKCN